MEKKERRSLRQSHIVYIPFSFFLTLFPFPHSFFFALAEMHCMCADICRAEYFN